MAKANGEFATFELFWLHGNKRTRGNKSQFVMAKTAINKEKTFRR